MGASEKRSLPILGITFLIFLTLKLTEIGVVANWSWWWVTAPLWAPIGLWFIIWILAFIFMFISAFIAALLEK